MSAVFQVRLMPEGGSFGCRGDQTVLDAAVDAGYWLPHSCRLGSCGTCALSILEGSVDHSIAASTTAAFALRDDQCLTCSARPRSDLSLHAPGVGAEPTRRVVKAVARVTEVLRPSPDVAIIHAQLPAASGWSFEPGQYAEIVLRDGSRRKYSMANRPDSDGRVEWHVRRIPGGRFSVHAYDALKVRDILRVEGPYGDFTLRDGDEPVLLLASGTGYAPIAAMLASHGESLARRRAVLYWGGRTRGDLYALTSEEAWRKLNPGIGLVPVLSEAPSGDRGRQGFVHEAVLQDFPDLSSYHVYACGNPLMVEAARASFTAQAGLNPERFFSDAFVFSEVNGTSEGFPHDR